MGQPGKISKHRDVNRPAFWAEPMHFLSVVTVVLLQHHLRSSRVVETLVSNKTGKAPRSSSKIRKAWITKVTTGVFFQLKICPLLLRKSTSGMTESDLRALRLFHLASCDIGSDNNGSHCYRRASTILWLRLGCDGQKAQCKSPWSSLPQQGPAYGRRLRLVSLLKPLCAYKTPS